MKNIILLSSLLFLIVSCKSDTGKTSVKTKNTSPKMEEVKNNNKPKLGSKIYWKRMQKQLAVDDETIKSLKALDEKFVRLIKKEIKNNNWKGAANLETRENLERRKKSQIKKLLGQKKYNKFVRINKGFIETRY